MENMGPKHLFLFLLGSATGAALMHFSMKPSLSVRVVTPKLVAEAVKGLSSWH